MEILFLGTADYCNYNVRNGIFNLREIKEYDLKLVLTAVIILLVFLPFHAKGRDVDSVLSNDSTENLVLIHGLTNKHSWGDEFLNVVLSSWGSNNVYVVYTNSSDVTYERNIDSKTVVYCGLDNNKAGDKSIEEQVGLLQKKIQTLQESKNLRNKFHIIAHSMGGLVARRYIYKYPGVVKGLVTLGTPHHGSPLADSFEWAGFFLSAKDAISNLRPSFIRQFNEKFPIDSSPLAENGRIYTIRGDCDGNDCFGWGGELFFGWNFITKTTQKDNDGLVPYDSAIIDGAVHIGDFSDFDHFDLVREPSVAVKAAEYLLKKINSDQFGIGPR